MEEQLSEIFGLDKSTKIIKRYEWDCMATSIFFGNKEIIKILEEKGIEKGKNGTHIMAAILSYRNIIAKEIIEDLNENNEQTQNILKISIAASAKSNNIKGVEFLMTKMADINMHDKESNSLLHYAAKNNSKEMLEILISKGADINTFAIIYLNMRIYISLNVFKINNYN